MPALAKIRLVTAAFLFALPFSPALAGDVVLENLTINEDKGVLRIARVEAINSSLSREEVQRLLDTSADGKVALELLSRFSADRFSISGAAFSGDEGTMIFAPILASGVDKGRVDRLKLDGVDIDIKNLEGAGAASLKVKALEMEKADFAPLLLAFTRGTPELAGLRAERMVWAGFEASVPDADLPTTVPGGNRIRLSLGEVTGTNQYAGEVPLRSSAKLSNLVIELPPSSQGGRMLADLGYKKLDLSMSGEARYDPASRSLVLENYSLSGVNAGQFILSGTFGNIDPSLLGLAVPQEKLAALTLANVSALEIRFINEGAVDSGFAFAAAQQGKNPAALRSEAALLAGQMLPMLLGGDPSALPIAQAVQTFLRDSKNFTLKLQARGAPLPLARLSSIGDPATFFALFDVSLIANQ
jgi:hypothetical protein